MSGVSTATLVVMAVSAAATLASTFLAEKPGTSSGASALKALGSWDPNNLGLDFGGGDDGGVLEFDGGSEDDNLAPSDLNTIGVGGLQEGGALEDMSLSTAGAPVPPPNQRAAEAPSQAGGMLDFVKDNQLLLGGVAKGLGAGISGYMQAESAKEIADRRARADSELLAQKDQQTTAKWAGTTPGMLNVGTAQRTPNPTPVEKYDPPAYRGQYIWDPAQNKFVFVQQPTAGA